MTNTTRIKEEVRKEIGELFNEAYCGMELPRISKQKVDHFVSRALNSYETKLYYETRRNNKKKNRGNRKRQKR